MVRSRTSPFSGFRSSISNFRFPDFNFRFPISDSGFRILNSDFRFPFSGFRIPISDFRFPIINKTTFFVGVALVIVEVVSTSSGYLYKVIIWYPFTTTIKMKVVERPNILFFSITCILIRLLLLYY